MIELNNAQKANARLIDEQLQKIKLTNIYLRAGILAVVKKETELSVITEGSYKFTPNDRIIQIFGASRFSGIDIGILKKNDIEFFNLVYNRKDLGNGPFDGYKYRGRGFNQITGKANYKAVGDSIGVDLVGHPELLSDPEIAAKAIANFFRQSIISGQTSGKFLLRYGIVTTSQIKTIEQGATIAHQANMGWKLAPAMDPTGGFIKTLINAPKFLEWIEQGMQ